MIDHHPDLGPDPLAGRDPHPREQIDVWPLHDARQALLEEIVSQPGPGQSPATRRFLLPVGIAAAIALVAGGAWFVVSTDDSGGKDDQLVASSDSPSVDGSTDEATDATTDATTTDEPSEPPEPTTTPISELKKGDVLSPKQCRLFRIGRRDISVRDLDNRLEQLSFVVYLRKNGRVRWIRAIPADEGGYLGIDKDCTVVSVGPLPRLRERH